MGVPSCHGREHRLAAIADAHDLRGDDTHHDAGVGIASILQPQLVGIDVDAVLRQRLTVLINQFALDRASLFGENACAEEVADVGDPQIGRASCRERV